jgi:hypothetical protein
VQKSLQSLKHSNTLTTSPAHHATATKTERKTHMTKISFPNGGFVIHKISHLSSKRISAWFDKDGKPVAAEYMPDGRSVALKHKSIWASLASVGRAWLV